jgi:hypothetical protein
MKFSAFYLLALDVAASTFQPTYFDPVTLRSPPPAIDVADQIEFREKLAWLDHLLPQSNLTEADRLRIRAAKIHLWGKQDDRELFSARALRRILEDPDVRRYFDFTLARMPIRSWTRFIEARQAQPFHPHKPTLRIGTHFPSHAHTFTRGRRGGGCCCGAAARGTSRRWLARSPRTRAWRERRRTTPTSPRCTWPPPAGTPAALRGCSPPAPPPTPPTWAGARRCRSRRSAGTRRWSQRCSSTAPRCVRHRSRRVCDRHTVTAMAAHNQRCVCR